MEVEWKQDMHKSYLLLKKEGENSFCVNMLLNNAIKGLIRPDLNIVDNQYVFRYETTSLKKVSNIIEKLCKEDLKKLLFDLIEILKEGKEYLLNENDYILDPEYMFYHMEGKELRLCYLDGYHENIKKQICSWMEFLMGNLDHKDRDNVVLVYGLYQISTNDNCTFRDLVHYINTYQENGESQDEGNMREEERVSENDLISDEMYGDKNGNVGIKEVVNEERGKAYEKNGYHDVKNGNSISMLTISMIAIPILIIYLYISGLLHTSKNGGLDWKKVGCTLVIAIFVEGVLFIKYSNRKKTDQIIQNSDTFQKNAIIMKPDGVLNGETNSCEKYEASIFDGVSREDSKIEGEEYIEEFSVEENDSFIIEEETDMDESCESTMVLSEVKSGERYILRSKEPETYQDIVIVEIPFFIGKLKAKADGVIDNKLISRYHAKIHQEKDEFYLTDLASTNGTFLNGSRLNTNEKRKLQFNDEVGFANIKYRFIVENSCT